MQSSVWRRKNNHRTRIASTIQPVLSKERIATYVYFSTLYCVGAGSLYLWGYWGTFGINILEYLSLTDIVKLTAYPIASAFAFLALGGVIGLITSNEPKRQTEPSTVANFILRHRARLVLGYVTLTSLLLVFAPVEKWHVLPALIALPMGTYIATVPSVEASLPNLKLRIFVVFVLSLLIPYAYGHGKLRAAAVLEGREFDYVLSDVEGVSVAGDTPSGKRLRYLGHAGESTFYVDPQQGTVIISRLPVGKSLIVKRSKS